jgi:hypothetical protein
MKTVALSLGGLVLITLALSSAELTKPAPTKPKLALALKPQHMTDALRAVILSDREVYTHVSANQPSSSAGSQTGKPLPSPCEMLRAGSQSVASKGVEFSYVLRSLKPLNQRNVPETEIETKGLQFVSNRPDLVYTAEELLGGRWYFTAVYPDVAVSQSCVVCHSQKAAGTELKVGDVLGGLVVRIALEL